MINRLLQNGWPASFITLYVISNILIGATYYYIPFRMYSLYNKRKHEIPNPSVLKLFIWFPIGCGLSRIGHVLNFWWDWYVLYMIFDWVSVAFFIIVAFRLNEVIDYLIHIQTNDQINLTNSLLTKEVKIREEANHQLDRANVELRFLIKKFENIISTEMWIHNKKKTLEELNEILTMMKNNNELMGSGLQ